MTMMIRIAKAAAGSGQKLLERAETRSEAAVDLATVAAVAGSFIQACTVHGLVVHISVISPT